MISTFSMNFLPGLHALVLASSATTTTAKPASSSGTLYFFIFIVIIVGVYLAFIRPRSQAARRAQMQKQQQQYEIGDRVLTRAGIVGHVVGYVGDNLQLEIAQGVVIEVVRQAIGQKMAEELEEDDSVPPPPGADDDDEDGEADEHEQARIDHEWLAGDDDHDADENEDVDVPGGGLGNDPAGTGSRRKSRFGRSGK
jgi:preprotein translocase subunit YajC